MDIKNDADRVLELNQSNMKAENQKAHEAAARSKRVMIVALLASAAIATLIAFVDEPVDSGADPGGHTRRPGE